MKDWKLIAAGRGLQIPGGDLERIAKSLDDLEAAFRPLANAIPHQTEPAVIFHPGEESGE